MSEEFLLVDTSFLVALLDVQDSLHQRAEEIERELASLKLIFTDVVYGETLSVLSRRIISNLYYPSFSSPFPQPLTKPSFSHLAGATL